MPDGVVSSGGVLPVSLAIHRDLVYVANSGNGGSNYAGFRLAPTGPWSRSPGRPSRCRMARARRRAVQRRGTKLAGTRVGTSQIDSFTVGSHGRLKAAPGSPFPAQGLGPFGSEFRPTNPDQLFVSNAHNAGSGTVSAFGDSADGTLSSIGASPFADSQTAPCWVEISHNGKFLFTVNTGSGSVSRYRMPPTSGRLQLLGSTPLRDTSNPGAVDARLSPDGRNLMSTRAGGGRRVRGQRRQPDRTGQLPHLAARPRYTGRPCRHLARSQAQPGAGGSVARCRARRLQPLWSRFCRSLIAESTFSLASHIFQVLGRRELRTALMAPLTAKAGLAGMRRFVRLSAAAAQRLCQ